MSNRLERHIKLIQLFLIFCHQSHSNLKLPTVLFIKILFDRSMQNSFFSLYDYYIESFYFLTFKLKKHVKIKAFWIHIRWNFKYSYNRMTYGAKAFSFSRYFTRLPLPTRNDANMTTTPTITNFCYKKNVNSIDKESWFYCISRYYNTEL